MSITFLLTPPILSIITEGEFKIEKINKTFKLTVYLSDEELKDLVRTIENRFKEKEYYLE
jgi:hypothetical protein